MSEEFSQRELELIRCQVEHIPEEMRADARKPGPHPEDATNWVRWADEYETICDKLDALILEAKLKEQGD